MAKIFDESQTITITTKTFDNLTRLGSDCLNMYMKYIYHSKIQKTNQVFATVGFMAKGLGWGRDRTRKVKKILQTNEFIKNIIGRSDDGKFVKWFVKINGLITTKKLEQIKSYPTENQEGRGKKSTLLKTPLVVKPVGKCLKDNNIKCLKDNNFAKSNSPKQTTANSELGDAKLDNPDRREELNNNRLANNDILEKYLTQDELVEIMLNLGVEKYHVRQALSDCLKFYGGNAQKGKILVWLEKPSNYSRFIKGRI